MSEENRKYAYSGDFKRTKMLLPSSYFSSQVILTRTGLEPLSASAISLIFDTLLIRKLQTLDSMNKEDVKL